jgi:3',5'-cyclic AMP phosphodiesterase CpdA
MTCILHASDLHFGAEDRAALTWFASEVRRLSPTLVVITGDLTQRGTAREFAAAGDWLSDLQAPVLTVPGNHDLPLLDPVARLLWPYRRYSRLARRLRSPVLDDRVAIAPLKTTARAQLRLNWAEGRVDPASLETAVTALERRPSGSLGIVACHHPLLDLQGMRVPGRTRGGRAAAARLARAGAGLILSGHVHDAHDIEVDIAGRRLRMVGAGTLSERLRSTPPSYNRIALGLSDIAVEPISAST